MAKANHRTGGNATTPSNGGINLSARDEAVIVSVAGVANLQVLVAARLEGIRFALEEDLRNVLVDCSGAVVVMAPADWDAFTNECLAVPYEAPGGEAYLLNATIARDSWEHCIRMSRAGRICLGFEERDKAHRWAFLSYRTATYIENRSQEALIDATLFISRAQASARKAAG